MEISRNVLAGLLLLVIVVSGFGTWSLLSRDTMPAPSGLRQPDEGGEIALTIYQPPQDKAAVALNIGVPEATNG